MTPDPTLWPPQAPEAKREGAGPASPRAPGPLSPRRLALPLALFLATVATTIAAGAIQQGVNPLTDPGLLYRGVPFSFTLLLILGAHEMGHYLVSRRHQLTVTLPFFIPAPPIPFFIGTFGAFIRIRSPIQDKRALMDVGCAGPLIGVAVSIPVTLVGLKLSTITVMQGGHEMLALGEPLLYQFLSWLAFGTLSPQAQVILHPVAFAGWIGMLVTSLNLIPVGQLDGGHVSYALFPEYHRRISLGFLGLLVACGLIFWYGWLIWAVLLSFLGWRHPQPSYYWLPLDARRRWLGFFTILVFALTFCPTPLSVVSGSNEPNGEVIQANKAATGQWESTAVAFPKEAPPGRHAGLPWKTGHIGWFNEAHLTFGLISN
ncbi:MAG: site-2 protease family protein [Desulfobaccales bacterium]